MAKTAGAARVRIGLIDGPVVADHPAMTGTAIRHLGGPCAQRHSAACWHGTIVAGVLSSRRDAPAPGICPGCTLVSRPIFSECATATGRQAAASPRELVRAILAVLDAGVQVINLSVAVIQPSRDQARDLGLALDRAAQRGVLVVAAAGNQGGIGSTPLTRHPWVIPVVALGAHGGAWRSNLGRAIGLRGLGAPGQGIRGLAPDGGAAILAGTSVAAPFVTGTLALLLSLFPGAGGPAIRMAVLRASGRRPATVTPPMLDAWEAYRSLKTNVA